MPDFISLFREAK